MPTSKLNRDNVRRNIGQTDRKDLLYLLKAVRRELRRRGSRKVELLNGWQGFANFLAGASWAMACRAELRAAHDHPRVGKRAASGEMWLPAELVKTVRLGVKERGFSALTAPNFSHMRAQWAGYLQHAGKSMDVSGPSFADMMAENAMDSLRYTTFKVGFAKAEARRIIDLDTP